jgi:apolipoprotein N-acyltransferase
MRLGVTLPLLFLAAYFPLSRVLPSDPNLKNISAAIIQTQTPSQASTTAQERLSIFRQQLELLDRLSKEHPQTDLVVFPEGSDFFINLSLFGDTFSLSQYFARLFPQATFILDNARMAEEDHWSSRTLLLNSQEGIVGAYDKYLLTPGGEYVPSLIRRLDQVLALEAEGLRKIKEFKKGEVYPAPLKADGFSLLPLVCSDVASPELAKPIGGILPDILAVQASFGFAHGSSELIAHTKAMAKFRAAENQRSLVFASNFGPSFMLSPDGSTSAETSRAGFEILTGPLVLNKNKTLYNRIGDGPMVMVSLGVLAASFFLRKKEQ